MKKILFSILFLGAIMSSCVKSNNDPEPTPEKSSNLAVNSTSTPAVSVKISVDMNVGDVLQLGVTITPANYDKSLLVWSSSNGSVVAVSKTGLLTAKAQGKATIYISNSAKTVLAKTSVSVFAGNGLKTGLIAYYPFNNGSAIDSSGNNNNGTISSIKSVPDRFNKANRAFYFDGTSGYIKVKDNPDLRLSNTDFTINTWVNLEEYNSSFGTQVIDKRVSGMNSGWSFSITGQDFQNTGQGNLGLLSFGEGGTSFTTVSKNAIPLNKWVMITTVYSISKEQISYYTNGSLDVTVSNVTSPNSSITSDLYIGKDNPVIPSNGYRVKGTLDDIRIYRRALSVTDIQKLHTLPY